MNVNEKIKNYREQNKWSQEDMANQLQMSSSAYAKIERGETRLHLDKLQKIAQIFNIDLFELITMDGKNIILNINESGESNNTNYSNANETLVKDVENLQNLLQQKDILLAEKDQRINELQQQIQTLNDMINLLKKQH